MSASDSGARRAARRIVAPAPWRVRPMVLARAAAAVVFSLNLAGCAKFDAALGQQWAVVHFKSNTSVATLLKVRTACSHVPNVHAEQLPKVRDAATMVYALRYRTDSASDANLAALQVCLQRFPSVAGIAFGDPSGS